MLQWRHARVQWANQLGYLILKYMGGITPFAKWETLQQNRKRCQGIQTTLDLSLVLLFGCVLIKNIGKCLGAGGGSYRVTKTDTRSTASHKELFEAASYTASGFRNVFTDINGSPQFFNPRKCTAIA